ncbi:MAG: deoxynucleoside kinase [Alkalispirochaeta sp.]
MILIEGQIGVGKTTIGEIVQERFGITLYQELNNPDTLALLDRFYADKQRWAFTLQIHFLNERFRMIKEIFRDGGGVLDRSIFGDRIFAEMLAADGDMSGEEFRTYSTLLDNMLEHVQKPQLLIYLDASVDTAMERIKMRNRGLESGIPREYLEELNRRYLAWYAGYDLSPKIFVNTEEFHVDNPKELEPVIRRIGNAIEATRT